VIFHSFVSLPEGNDPIAMNDSIPIFPMDISLGYTTNFNFCVYFTMSGIYWVICRLVTRFWQHYWLVGCVLIVIPRACQCHPKQTPLSRSGIGKQVGFHSHKEFVFISYKLWEWLTKKQLFQNQYFDPCKTRNYPVETC
jgi:hypothetical protein